MIIIIIREVFCMHIDAQGFVKLLVLAMSSVLYVHNYVTNKVC